MKPKRSFARSLAVVVSVLVGAALAVSPSGCSTPRTPESAAAEADGGELTCDERARAQAICQSAMHHRCESQQNDCEGQCDVHGNLPGNNEKGPSARNDMESTQCRGNCRQVHDGCERAAAQQCPAPCN